MLSQRTPAVAALAAVLLGVVGIAAPSSAQWVFGSSVTDESGFIEAPLAGPGIIGTHSDGATSMGLPGSFPTAFLSFGGNVLEVASGVQSYTQTITTPGQYTSTLTLGGNYSTSGTTFDLGISPSTIELSQTNLGGPPTPATTNFYLLVPFQYDSTLPFVNITGTYSFSITASNNPLGASDSILVRSCTVAGKALLFDPTSSVCSIYQGAFHGQTLAGASASVPIAFNGSINFTIPSNTRHTHTTRFALAVENGGGPQTITISDFEFQWIATEVPGVPALPPLGQLALCAALLATGRAMHRARPR